jgi:hypothetical protein
MVQVGEMQAFCHKAYLLWQLGKTGDISGQTEIVISRIQILN